MTSSVMTNASVAGASLIGGQTPVAQTAIVQSAITSGSLNQRQVKNNKERASSSNDKKLATESSGSDERVDGAERTATPSVVTPKKRKLPGKGDHVDVIA